MKKKKTYIDLTTGDTLTPGEMISWKIQGIIRNWWFIIGISLVTVIVWSTNNAVALLWWNLCASYLAIFIESLVGISMLSQTKRDALLIRKIERLEEQNAALLERIDTFLEGNTHAYPAIR